MLLTTIREANVTFVPQTLRVPMRLSSGVITEITEARVEVTVEVDGRRGVGRGAIYLSDVWAWPDPHLTHAERDLALRRLCEQIAGSLPEYCGREAAHPTELGLRLHHAMQQATDSPVPTVLARILCASPFDAAIHDAAGMALGRSAFTFYDAPVSLPGADASFPDGGACAAIARALRPPRICKQFDAWLCVSKDDTLEGDIRLWIQERGYRCFKLKLLGKDSAADVARTTEIYRGIQELGAVRPRLSADSNEGNPDAASVLEYLERLQTDAPDVFAALEYLEQPTSRDIREPSAGLARRDAPETRDFRRGTDRYGVAARSAGAGLERHRHQDVQRTQFFPRGGSVGQAAWSAGGPARPDQPRYRGDPFGPDRRACPYSQRH